MRGAVRNMILYCARPCASRIKRFYKLFITDAKNENIRKNSGKYGSISFFLLKYIKAMTGFLVFDLEANNVLL
jgi:hypothetical protein